MRLTGITGGFEKGSVDGLLGRLGKEGLALEPSCPVSRNAGLLLVLPGVEGYDDRNRGVPFMAYSGVPQDGSSMLRSKFLTGEQVAYARRRGGQRPAVSCSV